MRRSMLGCLLLTALACGDAGLGPRPLDVTIEASPATAATGEAVNFVVNAQGDRLVGVTVDYGDGVVAQVALHSARTARVPFEHTYSATGTYEVRATVLDAVAGSKDATVEVRIQ